MLDDPALAPAKIILCRDFKLAYDAPVFQKSNDNVLLHQ